MTKEYVFYEEIINLDVDNYPILALKPFEKVVGSHLEEASITSKWIPKWCLLIMAEKEAYFKDMDEEEKRKLIRRGLGIKLEEIQKGMTNEEIFKKLYDSLTAKKLPKYPYNIFGS